MRIKLNETQTYPFIIHANGKSKRSGQLYKNIVNKFLETTTPLTDVNDDCTIVTWKGGKYLDEEMILETCMRYYDHPVVILPWPNITNFWEASKIKINGTLDFLKTNVNTKYFMWFDVSDVLLLKPPSEILTFYKNNFDDKLIFCAERNHYPKENRQTLWSSELKEEYKSLENYDNKFDISFRYMNTGCCVGETKILIEFLNKCQEWMNEPINDTVAGRLAQKEMSDRVLVDRNCEMFLCLYDVNENEVVISE
jgi:hypothetical protein